MQTSLADRHRKEPEERRPLEVPGQGPPRLQKQIGFRNAVLSKPVDEQVVSFDHGHLHLRYEQVCVLTRVSHERDTFLVAR